MRICSQLPVKESRDPKLDRSTWGEGEWQHEPDRVEWCDDITGLKCLARRGPVGAWCGYVGVPPGHPLYGADNGKCLRKPPCKDEDGELRYCEHTIDNILTAHGGITYSDTMSDVDKTTWWFGFDCAHAYDLAPTLEYHRITTPSAVYRTLDYVMSNIESLALQIYISSDEEPAYAV
jgi:hypothetical protein